VNPTHLLILTTEEFTPDTPNLGCEVYSGPKEDMEGLYQEALASETSDYKTYLLVKIEARADMTITETYREDPNGE